MRPTKLSMEGFTSFRRPAEVDFTGLDLFAITGPTGSGKTSILDAVTFALYGQTSRLGSKGLSDLITQGSQRLSVLLEFETGGKRYRVARVLKRSGPASVRFEALEDGEWRPFDGGARELAPQISKIVGLDFDAFVKAVVLPQGQFDQFLRGDRAQRRQILEALLNLGVYRDMMQLANARQGDRQKERDLIKGQLEREYADATEEALQALLADIEKLDREVDGLSAQSVRVDDLRPEALELRQKRETVVNSDRDLGVAEEELAREEKSAEALVGETLKHEQDLQRLEQELLRVPYDELLHQKLIALLPVAEQLERTGSDHTAKVKDADVKAKNLEGIDKKLEVANQDRQKSADKNLAAQESQAAAQQRFVSLKEKYGSAEVVEDVAREIAGIGALEQQLQRDRDQHGALEAKQTDIGTRVTELKAEEAEAKKARDQTQEAYEKLFQRHSAEELRKHLKKGDTCPVCEQSISRLPKRVPAADLDQARAEAEKCQQTWHKKQQSLAKAEAELTALPSQIESANEAIARTAKQMSGVKEKTERVLGEAFSKDTLATLKRIAVDLRAAESELKSREREAKETAKAEAEAKDALVAIEREAALLKQAIATLSEQIASATREIERLCGQLSGTGDVEAIRTGLKAQGAAKQQLTQIEAKIAASKKARDEADKKRVGVGTRVAGLKGGIEVLSTTRDAAKLEAFKIEEGLKAKLAGLVLPAGRDEAERIDKLLGDLRARYSDLKRQLDQKEVRSEQVTIRIAEAAEKRARVSDLERSALLYGQLGLLLRADQFIKFILEGAFDLLCEEGTRQLLILSQGRYSFHSDGNDFDVVDHWNADERRSVRTLSGGESFLASLALALALAGSVSQFSEGGPFKLDALFLDEGFSTLDAETLNVAIDALQALQEGDRMIAVISHVTDLAERLPGRIQIVKGVSGSEVKLEHESAAATS